MFSIRTYNKISDKGLSLFPSSRYSLGEDEAAPQGIILRSHKLHNEVLPDTVRAVARAGAGTNNVPVADYSEKGIVVFNSPGANANAVKELVLAGMLLSSRGILEGHQYVSSLTEMSDAAEMSNLMEKEKKRFSGSELQGKTLGIIGLGAIGSLVADAALNLGMNVLGYDPALSVDAAWRLPSTVERQENLQSMLPRVDYLSLHVPAIDATKNLINAETLSQMKASAVLLNFAREAIVNSSDVVSALDNQALRRYICDFPEPQLIGREDVLALPHIGASTAEAEENCAIMAARQLMDYLENGNIVNSVNFPTTQMPRTEGTHRISFTNKNVSGVLSEVLGVIAKHKFNVADLVNKSRGELAYSILDLDAAPNEALIAEICKLDPVINVEQFAN